MWLCSYRFLFLIQLQSNAVNYAQVILKSDSWSEMTLLCNTLLQLVNNVQEIPAIRWEKEPCENERYPLRKINGLFLSV